MEVMLKERKARKDNDRVRLGLMRSILKEMIS
jgi:hypothetical protein